MRDYDFTNIEAKWQKAWRDTGLFKVDVKDIKNKYYCLMMFPYPSAALHVGHGRNYIIGDVVARYKKMKGANVLAPMGFDAFGLPAENAAIKGGLHPRVSTLDNIATMKKQLASWGVEYDWDREVTSCLPDYYKWTQWIFLKLYEKGLAYRKKAFVNWCPSCNTVLANEQVVNGGCERCDASVEQKELEQWFFRITGYAQRLLDDIDKLKDWPEKVRIMQRNWIGRSEGVNIDFPVADSDMELTCFTTRVDTIYGCTYMVLAAEHPKLKGPGIDQNGFDPLTALENWVEKGTAPDTLASRQTDKDGRVAVARRKIAVKWAAKDEAFARKMERVVMEAKPDASLGIAQLASSPHISADDYTGSFSTETTAITPMNCLN